MKKWVLLLFCFIAVQLIAQEKRIHKANYDFESLTYIKAIKKYKRLADKGVLNDSISKKIADAYYFNAAYKEAYVWYDQLYKKGSFKFNAHDYLRYAQSLKASNKNTEANIIFKKYSEMAAISEDFSIMPSDSYFEFELLPINSPKSDYGSFYSDGQLYFASARDKENRAFKDGWNNDSFVDIYKVNYKPESDVFGQPIKLKEPVNSKLHESSAFVNLSGEKLFFTATNREKHLKKGTTYLKIYEAYKQNNDWTNVIPVSFNEPYSNTAHLCISKDGKTFIFSSDRKGSLGLTDLYKVTLKQDGSFGTPENLGPTINTPGRESFPFLDENDGLYFASDGHLGLGGYDLYYKNLEAPFSPVVHLGKSINSAGDDFAFCKIPGINKGFFSSNRTAKDAIYSFVQLKDISSLLKISGKITDEHSLGVKNTLVTLLNKAGKPLEEVRTNTNGFYVFTNLKQEGLSLLLEKENYKTATYSLNLNNTQNSFIIKQLEIDKEEKSAFVELGELKETAAYFAFNSSKLTASQTANLTILSTVLKANTALTITIEGHSDSRGSLAYNKKLSLARANYAKAFLISQGVSRERINTLGLANSKPVNLCNNGCNKNQHAQNRRLEFTIL